VPHPGNKALEAGPHPAKHVPSPGERVRVENGFLSWGRVEKLKGENSPKRHLEMGLNAPIA